MHSKRKFGTITLLVPHFFIMTKISTKESSQTSLLEEFSQKDQALLIELAQEHGVDVNDFLSRGDNFATIERICADSLNQTGKVLLLNRLTGVPPEETEVFEAGRKRHKIEELFQLHS